MSEEGIERWRGRVAVVTGASSGIGRAVASALAKAGMRVALGARRLDKLEEVVESLHPAEAWAFRVDVCDPTSVWLFFDALDNHWGAVDVLVNNAGVGFKGTQWAQDEDEWVQMFDVNVVGLLRTTKAALQRMERAEDRPSHIFHISSMAAHRVPAETSVYSATKHAVKALTEGLRFDLRAAGRSTRVTSISPGFVETEFLEPYLRSTEAVEAVRAAYPLLTPDDVANAVLYALSAPEGVQVHDIQMRPTQQPT